MKTNDLPIIKKTMPASPIVVPSKAFNTFDFGSLEGKKQTKERNEYIHNNIINNPSKKMSAEGETWDQAYGRVTSAMNDLIKNAKNNTTVVTHNSVFGLINLWNKEGRPKSFDEKQRIAYTKQDLTFHTGEFFKVKSDNGTIYVVRHGETEDNADGNFRSSDTKLTEKGIKQAEQVGEKLKDVDIPKIIPSTLPRAIKTANIILEKQNHSGLKPVYSNPMWPVK